MLTFSSKIKMNMDNVLVKMLEGSCLETADWTLSWMLNQQAALCRVT